MQQNDNTKIPAGTTEIFRMQPLDSTFPDLMGNSPSHPTLTIVKGPHTGETFVLDMPEVDLGRDPQNTVFLNDMTVSRRHAKISLAQISTGVATVEDLGSLNGTWVDGAIVNKAVIRDGTTIQIGTFRMVFHTNARRTHVDTGV